MELIKVESSNIDAIGYSDEFNLMRVRFRDGSSYDYPAVSVDRHAALMSAQSKGAHLAQHFQTGVRCLPEAGDIRLREPHVVETHRQIETFEADDCCQKRLMKAQRTGDTWFCDRCGQEWRKRLIGDVRHWAPFEVIAIW